MENSAETVGKPPLGPKTWFSWFGALLLSIVSLLPIAIHRGIAAGLSSLYIGWLGANSRHVRTAKINLEACFPDMDDDSREQLLRNYFKTLVIAVLHMPKQWWRGKAFFEKNHSRKGMDELASAREEGVPCILLITHTVGLDAGMVSMSLDLPLTGFYKPFANPVVDWLIRRSRVRFGGIPFARGEGFRDILRRVKSHEVLCYLCDEDYGPEASVFAPFFGHQKATLKMLPKIVRSTKAKVFPMSTSLNIETGQYEVHIQSALAGYPSGDEESDAAIINAAIEESIRLDPKQYLWKLQLFKSCPNGKDSRYLQVARGELEPKNL